jgi:fatty acid desaturase
MSSQLSAAVVDVRESMRVLPSALQPVLTWLTCKPLPDEEPWKLTPLHHLAGAVLALVGGAALGIFAATLSGLWLLLLPVGWLLIIHAVRKLRSVVVHQCAHSNFLPNQFLNDLLGETVSIITFTQNYAPYKREHIFGHHSTKHMTVEDPTVAFLLRMIGARAGMPAEELWSLLKKKIVSPAFHLKFLRIRLLSNFKEASLWHSLGMLFFWGSLLLVTAYTGAWLQFVLAWLLPMTIPLHMVECLRLSGKHVFPEQDAEKRGRQELGSFTHGIFVGELTPAGDLPFFPRMLAWAGWWLRLLFYHLPSRMMVLAGDAPCHDYHHRRPKSKDWPNYIFARQSEVVSPPPNWPPYTEVWGVAAAIDATFASLSAADPAQYEVKATEIVSEWELLEALEE